MGNEEYLAKRIRSQLAGELLPHSPQPVGGPLNIRGMGLAGAYLDAELRKSKALLGRALPPMENWLEQQKVDGHMSRRNQEKKGEPAIQGEQMTPENHDTFYYIVVLGCLLFALRNDRERLYRAALDWLGAHLSLCQRFEYKGVVLMPRLRAKNTKKTRFQEADDRSKSKVPVLQWRSGWDDDLLAYARGEKPAPALVRLGVKESLPPPVCRELLAYSEPVTLFAPIRRVGLGDGRFQAWFEPGVPPLGRSEYESVSAVGNNDVLSCVRVNPNGDPKDPDLVFDWIDWREAFPLPEGSIVEVVGSPEAHEDSRA